MNLQIRKVNFLGFVIRIGQGMSLDHFKCKV
jgi:hypothetical protein